MMNEFFLLRLNRETTLARAFGGEPKPSGELDGSISCDDLRVRGLLR